MAKKWDYSHRRKGVGRPRTQQEVAELIVRMAKDNPTWGYDRIEGALKNLGIALCDTTVGNILREHGIEPAPKRASKTTWKTFLKVHWEVMGAADFVEHYHHEGNHQGLGNALIEPELEHLHSTGDITCRNRLGGMLRYYYREAA